MQNPPYSPASDRSDILRKSGAALLVCLGRSMEQLNQSRDSLTSSLGTAREEDLLAEFVRISATGSEIVWSLEGAHRSRPRTHSHNTEEEEVCHALV